MLKDVVFRKISQIRFGYKVVSRRLEWNKIQAFS